MEWMVCLVISVSICQLLRAESNDTLTNELISDVLDQEFKSPPAGHCCENGWMKFENSCYWFIRKPVKYATAVGICAELGASMIVISSLHEQNMVLHQGAFDRNTWIGYSNKFSATEFWQTDGGINIDDLKWLVKLSNHGYNPTLACAAHFNPSHGINQYYHFHNCQLPYMAICERNATAIFTVDNQK